MAEAKPFASLSSGLLARKGAARPAMRPQGFGQGGNGLEDLGWDDMGFDPPKPVPATRDADHDAFGDDVVEHPRAPHPTGLTPIQSPVHHQQAELADRLGAEEADEDVDDTAEPYIPEAEAEAEAEEAEAEAEAQAEAQAEVEAEAVTADAAPMSPPAAPATRASAIARTAPAPRRASRPRSAPGSKAKAAFTLRLDPERHLKLRLACAVGGRSAQQLVTHALDELLAHMPELDSMAAKAKRKG